MSQLINKRELTETAGTVINVQIDPKRYHGIKITDIQYTAAGTAHTLTVMDTLAETTVDGDADAAQAEIVLAADPGGLTPASGDYMVFEKPDGTFFWSTVSSWNGTTLTVTLNDNVPSGGISDGAKAWFLGVAGDHATDLPTTASTVNKLNADKEIGLATSAKSYQPMMLQSDNATNAGAFDRVDGIYFPFTA